MSEPQITVKGADGASASVAEGASAQDALQALGTLRGQVVAAKVDGRLRDLDARVTDGTTVEPVPADTEEGRAVVRHSVAHILAQAVTDLFPGAKFAIGPPIDNGFHYDFDVDEPFTPEDLERIEDRMREIVAEDQQFRRRDVARDAALALFADQPYKRELIERATSSPYSSVRREPTIATRRVASPREPRRRSSGST